MPHINISSQKNHLQYFLNKWKYEWCTLYCINRVQSSLVDTLFWRQNVAVVLKTFQPDTSQVCTIGKCWTSARMILLLRFCLSLFCHLVFSMPLAHWRVPIRRGMLHSLFPFYIRLYDFISFGHMSYAVL